MLDFGFTFVLGETDGESWGGDEGVTLICTLV